MKLLIDMNLSPSWADRLARRGFEAVHWSVIGAPTSPDDEILSWGREHGFVVVTNDLDFSAILAATSERAPSVVQVRMQDLLSDAAVDVIAFALEAYREEVERGVAFHRGERYARANAAAPSRWRSSIAHTRVHVRP